MAAFLFRWVEFVNRRYRFASIIVSMIIVSTIVSALFLSFGPVNLTGEASGWNANGSDQLLHPGLEFNAVIIQTGSSSIVHGLDSGLPLVSGDQAWDQNNTEMKAPLHADDYLPFFLITFLAFIVGLSAILVLGWPIEILTVPIFSTLSLLYARLADKDPLDNYRRGLIHGFILAHPGVSFSELKRGLELANGSLVYHIHILEKEGLIHSRRAGNLVLYYSSDANPQKLSESRWTDLQLKIMRTVAKAGEISKSDLRTSVGCSHQLLHYNLKRMVADGVLAVRFQYGRRYFSLGPGYNIPAIMELLDRKHMDQMALNLEMSAVHPDTEVTGK